MTASLIVVPAVSFAVPPTPQFSGSVYYDLKDRYTAAVGLVTLSPLTVHGKRLVDVSALAGVRNGDSAPIGGLEFGRSWQVFDQVSIHAGIAVVQPQGGKLGAGVVVGLSYRF